MIGNAESLNKLSILMESKDLDKFKEFMDSDTLKDAMKEAGVMGPPEVSIFPESETFAN